MIKKRSLFQFLIATVFIVSGCRDFKSIRSPSTGNSNPEPSFSTQQLMTAEDVLNSADSKISITNAAGVSIAASGLFIASFDVNDCSMCTGNILSGNNAMGALVEPVTFEAGQSINIGQNYLYNLIYNGFYAVRQNVGSVPCQLPGCSWPGDDGSVTGWCLSIGVMSRHASYTSSSYANGAHSPANVVPFSDAIASIGLNYNYNLIDPNTLGVGNACLGPIVCDDQTLTCSVSAPQTQSFQSY